jgi:hypothetical protein
VAEAGSSGGRRARKTTAAPAEPTTTPEPAGPSSAGSNGSTGASSDTTANPLGLERDRWAPSDREQPADVDTHLDDYVAPPPELLEWTPERAGAIVRAGGFLLHTADPVAREEIAKELEIELWRATEDDVSAIAPPLARILNRYAPARRLAGVSDEMELAFGMIGYLRENLADRGRIVTVKRRREAEPETGEGGTMFGHGVG